MSSTAWIAIGVIGLVGLAALVAALRRGTEKDLGSVSDQWIAQHRAGNTLDGQ